jgi:hypothetical protein
MLALEVEQHCSPDQERRVAAAVEEHQVAWPRTLIEEARQPREVRPVASSSSVRAAASPRPAAAKPTAAAVHRAGGRVSAQPSARPANGTDALMLRGNRRRSSLATP